MPKNTFGKTRDKSEPYAVYKNESGWEWRILKTYKHADSEKKDPYARWFVAATSPLMFNGEFEYGDTYCKDILTHGRLVEDSATQEWLDQYSN